MAYLSSFTNAEAYSNQVAIPGRSNIINTDPYNQCTWGNHCEISSTKVMAVYNDVTNGAATVVIGTRITESCIEWGTPVVFDSTGASYIIPVRVADDKFLIFYRDDGDTYAKARCGTISGTVPTLGNVGTCNAAASTPIGAALMDTDKVMLAYANSTTNGQAKICTMSGTNVTFGSAATFKATTDISAYTTLTQLCSHSTTLATVVYRVSATVTQCVTLTFDGSTTITANTGGLAAFGGTADIRHPSLCSISATSFVLAYTDVTDTNKGNAQVGTISGTTITAGASEYNFDSTNDSSGYRRPCITKISSSLVAILYTPGGTSQYYLSAKIYSVSSTVLSLLSTATIYAGATGDYPESIGGSPVRGNITYTGNQYLTFSYLTHYHNDFICGVVKYYGTSADQFPMTYRLCETSTGEQLEITRIMIFGNGVNFSNTNRVSLYVGGTESENKIYYGGYSDVFAPSSSTPNVVMGMANSPIVLLENQALYASIENEGSTSSSTDGSVTVFGVKRS